MDEIFYTIVDEKDGKESRVEISIPPTREEPVRIQFPFGIHKMSYQQLGELGQLLVALSHGEYDLESVDELLEGYGRDDLVPYC